MKTCTRGMYLLIISTIIAHLTIAAAVAEKVPAKKGKFGGSLTIALPSEPYSLDGRYMGLTGRYSNTGVQHMYDRLVEYAKEGSRNVVPRLAESWKMIDEKTWSVSIRKGVKFHNGKEVTAQDLKRCYDYKIYDKKYMTERSWKPPRGTSFARPIKEVEAIDKYTLKFTLKEPYAPFEVITLNWGFQGFIDPDVVEQYGRQATQHPIGTGPFEFVEYVPGDHIILKRFENYWGEKAYLDRVVFRIIPDGQTRFIALQKKEIDIAEVDLPMLPYLKKDPNLRYYMPKYAVRTDGFLTFNMRRWPMNSLKFRKALVMGVDWEKIIGAAFPKGTALPATSLLEGSWAENPEAKKFRLPFNPAKAKELLKEVQDEAGRPIPPLYALVAKRPGGYVGNVLTIAAPQYQRIGLKVNVYELEHVIAEKTTKDNPNPIWDIGILSSGGAGIHPLQGIRDYYSTINRAADGSNVPGYKNPEVDALYNKVLKTYDRKEQVLIYRQIEKYILQDLPSYPLFYLPFVYAFNKRVQDFYPHDSGNILLHTPWNNVWIEN